MESNVRKAKTAFSDPNRNTGYMYLNGLPWSFEYVEIVEMWVC